jgi:hypothetical protein
MALVTRRRFVQQTSFAAGALYGRPMKLLAGTHFFGERDQSASTAAPVDAAAIRQQAAKITGHVITPEASDYKSSRLVSNLAFDRYSALIVCCADASDVARSLDSGAEPESARGGARRRP